MSDFTVYLTGLGIGLSLIVAIGAQNAFVLRQGLRGSHVLPVVLTCALSDAVLIVVGVTSFARIAAWLPMIDPVMRYGGAAFLVWYGARNLRSALTSDAALWIEGAAPAEPLRPVLLTAVALTWLNPHVYLDTVVLLGSISAQYDNRLAFGAGAVMASFVFFFSLGYGARLLSPLFARPRSWQILDAVIALTMWAIAAKLLLM